MALDSVQPVPWVLAEAIFGAAKRWTLVGGDEEIDRLGAVEMAALHQHGAGTEREQRPPLLDHLGFARRMAAPSSAAASGRLGVRQSTNGSSFVLTAATKPAPASASPEEAASTGS